MQRTAVFVASILVKPTVRFGLHKKAITQVRADRTWGLLWRKTTHESCLRLTSWLVCIEISDDSGNQTSVEDERHTVCTDRFTICPSFT